MINRITQLLNARWLIDAEVVYNYLPVFLSFLNGQKFTALNQSSDVKPYAVAASGGQLNLVHRYDLNAADLPENSVALIPIQGEILSWRTMELVQFINQAESNPAIIAVIFLVNSPGGMVFYTDIAAAAIKSMQKPSVAFVLNVAASAAMWLISGTNRIIASSPMDRFGSIGVMAKVMDFSRMFKEKLNIDIYEICADKSALKNAEMRTLLDQSLTMEERTAPIRGDLNFVNDLFHQAICENLSITADSEVFDGKTYYAARAIELGLAHEINTFEYAANYVYKLGLTNSINNYLNFRQK